MGKYAPIFREAVLSPSNLQNDLSSARTALVFNVTLVQVYHMPGLTER